MLSPALVEPAKPNREWAGLPPFSLLTRKPSEEKLKTVRPNERGQIKVPLNLTQLFFFFKNK